MAEDKKLKIKKTDSDQNQEQPAVENEKASDLKKLPDLKETPEPKSASKKLLIKNIDSTPDASGQDSALKIKKPATDSTPDASGQDSALKIKKPATDSTPDTSGQGSALKIKKPATDSTADASGQGSALKIKKPATDSTADASGQGSALKIKKPGAPPTPGQASQSQPRPIENPLAKKGAPPQPAPGAPPTPGQASQSQPRPIENPLAKKGAPPQPAPGAPTTPGQASQSQPRSIENPLTKKGAPPQPQQPILAQPPAAPVQPAAAVYPPQPVQPIQKQPPPPMPTGYQQPPQPQAFPTGQPAGPSVNNQGPVFPTQQNQFTPGTPVPAQRTIYEQPSGSQGPVFPTNALDTANMGKPPAGAPPGTLAPPTHGKSTSAPLSAIMGEVKAAKKINVLPQQAAEVVKIKKPVGGLKDSRGNEFCMIPKGQYYIGLENDLEEVRAPFTMARFPVTKQEYFKYISEKNIDYSPEEFNEINKISPYPNCPAVMVSWQDAKAYCRWLRQITGEYYALPSIKEWECAARGKDGRIYPWGEEEPTAEISCFNDQILEPQTTASVDFYQNNVSPFGCVGMIGNVMEWTLDSFDDDRDPHILKGGSWISTIDFCNNITPCMSYPPEKRQEFVGFRLLYLPKDMYKEYKDTHSA